MTAYPQHHPAMGVARNIVNQLLDESGADVPTRQRINDACDQFTAGRLEEYAGTVAAQRDAALAIHAKEPDVLIDHIHRGLTPVYGDGCGECGVAWPCDTAKALGVTG